MGIFRDLFYNLEGFISAIGNYDYSKLILYIAAIFAVYLINFFIVKYIWKKKIDATLIELKKANLKATYASKKKNLFRFYLVLSIFLVFLFVMKDNLVIVVPILAAFAIISLISLGAQLNNIFLGLLFKSSFSTTNYEDMLFYFKDHPNDVCKIVKINLFKTVYKNERNGKLYSMENKDLNSAHIIHKALESLDYVEFVYMVTPEFPLDNYIAELKKKLDEEVSESVVDFKDLKDSIFDLRSTFNTAPYLKPSYDIDLKYRLKDEIEIKVMITIYNYDFENYADDFLKYKPNQEVKGIN